MHHHIKELHVLNAHDKLKKGAILLDVREPDEINSMAFDVENQIQIPVDHIPLKHIELPRNQEIIVGCHSGNRSRQITTFLMEQQFEQVFNLTGGIREWEDHGLPVIEACEINVSMLETDTSN
ncbi:MAG: rhodanese-like domain-containing protein [Microbacter sp.]